MTVRRIWNRWVQDGNTECHADSKQPLINPLILFDRHAIRMALRDHAFTSRALSQELWSFATQQMSARTFRRRLQRHALSAWRPWLQLPLTLHQKQKPIQCCNQGRTWCTNSETLFLQINNPGSVYRINMIASLFGGIVVNAHWQSAFVLVILAHNLA
ncbi:HTH_Tnp_Tc3_2 domain-containing protein [Trichonephila clavipes]|uniref:HTH_Tnp_Tc3_2 domain-containing protein n=1 Tax=Trichonephila clavipes TaxID=2585209 RepID=A0A8X6W6K4_TRICX|nr:HTH_Tnp_Tc3_2 domain-containing protein [Trichonephila clavipes]